MSTILAKILLVVVMSHVLRLIGRTAGPRWGGLALGLPCTTAVALAGCGVDRGPAFSLAMADHCLLGLAGAVVLPLGFAGSIRRGHRLGICVLAAALTYFGMAWMAGQLSPILIGGQLAVASLAVLAATKLAAGGAIDGDEPDETRPRPTWRTVALRTGVPIACLLVILAGGAFFGPIGSGLLGTFPGVGLTLLILTHLESGPAAALRMARSLPSGNFGMVAFLGIFRWASPEAGLGWGMAFAYLAAVAMLATVALIGIGGRQTNQTPRPIWPRPGRTFRPGLEALAA